MEPEIIQSMIEQGLAGAEVRVVGDGRHFEAQIIHEGFAGKSLVEQHQMVYRCLGGNMKEAIHALSLRTYTPAEFTAQETH